MKKTSFFYMAETYFDRHRIRYRNANEKRAAARQRYSTISDTIETYHGFEITDFHLGAPGPYYATHPDFDGENGLQFSDWTIEGVKAMVLEFLEDEIHDGEIEVNDRDGGWWTGWVDFEIGGTEYVVDVGGIFTGEMSPEVESIDFDTLHER